MNSQDSSYSDQLLLSCINFRVQYKNETKYLAV